MKKKLRYLSPGMRTIKTALAIIVCLFIYYVGERNGIADSGDAFLACIAAIISMRDTVERSVKAGFHRLSGTFIGAALGLLYSLSYPHYKEVFIGIFMTGLGVIILIVLCNLLKIPDAIAIGCVVFLFIAMQQADVDPVVHSIRRFIDTAVGILISVGINHFILNPKGRDNNDADDKDI